MLRDYIEKLCAESNDINENLNRDNVELTKKCKELEIFKNDQEEIFNKVTSELEGLKALNSIYAEKNKTLEISLKNKIDEHIETEIKYKNLNASYNELEERLDLSEKEKNDFINKMNELSQQISDLEKENMELLKKNKVLLISQENSHTEIVKQNQVS